MISVIIPTWLRPRWLARCLRALQAQSRPPEETIVVGRPEDCESRRVVTQAEHWGLPVRWLPVNRPGYVAPVRRGLEDANGDIVAMLDDDAEPDCQWLHALLQPFADPQVACVGGSVATSALASCVSVPRDSGRVRWYGKYVGGIGGDTQGPAIDVHGLQECNWAWRRSVLLGLCFAPVFNEDDGLHYGLDLCLQAIARGHRVVYVPAARVVHHLAPRTVGARQEDKERRAFVAGRNLMFIGLKRYSPAQRFVFLFWWFGVGEGQSHGIARGLVHLCLHPTSGWPLVRSAVRGRMDGLRWWLSDRSHAHQPIAISMQSHGT